MVKQNVINRGDVIMSFDLLKCQIHRKNKGFLLSNWEYSVELFVA